MSRQQSIHNALSESLNLDTLVIENESDRHSVPSGSETHFKVIAVSNAFESLSLIQRHRLINHILAPEFSEGLHALSLHLYTPSEWLKKSKAPPTSPPCHHAKKERNK